MRHKLKTIDELRVYLNSSIDKHNGFSYDGFINMIESNVNTSNIARAFNVDRRTVANWIEIYQQEKSNG